MTKLQRNIKRRRETLGMRQEDIADTIGCSRSHIANMENGYRDIKPWLPQLATALHTKPAHLMK